jgi:uncharacterized membrane protein (UPF0136 family)
VNNLTKYYWIFFGVLCAIGGAMGYLKAGSLISLIAGGICGLTLIYAGFRSITAPRLASILALIVSLVMLSRFIPTYIEKRKPMPAIPVIALSVISVGFAVVRYRKI